MARYFIAFSMICGLPKSYGQTITPIQTDRPDQTECPYIVPKNHFQMENGFLFEQTNSKTKTFFHPSSLSKFGLSDNFELRLIAEFTSVETGKYTQSGINPVTVGFKINIRQEMGIVPIISFIGHITATNISSGDFASTYYAPSFRFTMQHTVTEKIYLGYNLGAEWNGETPEPVFIYTLTAGYSISAKTGCYIELYGFAPQFSKADHRFDGGITYSLKKNILLDISGGAGLTANAPEFYAGLGFSFRLKD